MLLDADEYGLEPVALLARTVNVYEVEGVNPVIVIGLDAPVAVIEPGLESTVNVVAGPPVVVFAVNGTDAVDEVIEPIVPTVGASGMSTTLPLLGDVLLIAIDYAAIP
jgi:hypothetical protein